MSAAGTPSETPGHKPLSEEQKTLIAYCRNRGVDLEALITEILEGGGDPRWAAIAKTHFQEGLMAAVRSVAKPDFF